VRDGEVRIRPTGISWRDVNGEIVALDVESSAYFSTNRSGSVMWLALVGGSSRQQLVALLEREYGLSHDAAATDVDAFLAMLEQHGLLATDD